jgi:hypothetical protein
MLSSARPALVPSEPLEEIIGQAVASAALALAAGVHECFSSGLTPKTRTAGGDAIGLLWELKQATLGEIPDFEQIAREYGTKALAQKCNGGWQPRQGGVLIDGVIEILGKVCADAAVLRLH